MRGWIVSVALILQGDPYCGVSISFSDCKACWTQRWCSHPIMENGSAIPGFVFLSHFLIFIPDLASSMVMIWANTSKYLLPPCLISHYPLGYDDLNLYFNSSSRGQINIRNNVCDCQNKLYTWFKVLPQDGKIYQIYIANLSIILPHK